MIFIHCPQMRETILLLLHDITNLEPLISEENEMFLNSATGMTLKSAPPTKNIDDRNLKEINF